MPESIIWLFRRFAPPLAAAWWLLHARWGQQNIAYALTVPVFFFMLQMYLASRERPACPLLDRYKPFRRAMAWWNACEALA